MRLALVINSEVPAIFTTPVGIKKAALIDLNRSYIGEVINYSYVKINVEPAGRSANKSGIIPIKGNLYEAFTSKSFKIVGSYNSKTSSWILNCFDERNILYCTFSGKENQEGNIEGRWIHKKTVRKFYLKRQ